MASGAPSSSGITFRNLSSAFGSTTRVVSVWSRWRASGRTRSPDTVNGHHAFVTAAIGAVRANPRTTRSASRRFVRPPGASAPVSVDRANSRVRAQATLRRRLGIRSSARAHGVPLACYARCNPILSRANVRPKSHYALSHTPLSARRPIPKHTGPLGTPHVRLIAPFPTPRPQLPTPRALVQWPRRFLNSRFAHSTFLSVLLSRSYCTANLKL